MMRIKKLWLTTIAALLCCGAVNAIEFYDFEVEGIYYRITSEDDMTVAVTFRDFRGSGYSGSVIIPSEVTFEGGDYQVTSINPGAFERSEITSISIPESVTSIGEGAFYECIYLTSVNIPEGLTSIEREAFFRCSNLVSITIPKSVSSIGERAFYGCGGLTSIIVKEGNMAFDSRNNCNALIETKNDSLIIGSSATIIPEGVVSIGEFAFLNCSRLSSLTIPEGVTSIGRGAFCGCNSLSFISIPKSVVLIGNEAFRDCSSLTAINIPEDVTSIGFFTFSGCSNLTAIALPESVTSIGYGAFSGCSSLSSLIIPEGVTSLYYAFDGCSSLSSVILPESLTSIEAGTFSGCSSLASINIPKSVTKIDNPAFKDCRSLVDLYIGSLDSWIKLTFEDYSSRPNYYAKNVYIDDETGVVLPDTMKVIPDYLFYNFTGLTSVTIPDGVTGIGDYAFANCSNLASITIPESVTEIGKAAFYDCSSLKEVIIEDGGETLSIGDYTFGGCPLEKGYLGRNLSYNHSFGDKSPFYGKDKLTTVTIGNNVTSIGEGAFRGCSNLTSINIPEGVTSIGSYAFSDCSSLKELSLGIGMKKIDENAFSNSENVEKITIYAAQPPVSDGYIFSNKVYENATLYVPQGCVSKYQVMMGWSGFYNISEVEGNRVESVNKAVKIRGYEGELFISGSEVGDHIAVYNANGLVVAETIADGTSVSVSVSENQLYIVQVAGKVVKIQM